MDHSPKLLLTFLATRTASARSPTCWSASNAAPELLANVETQAQALRDGVRALDQKHQVFADVRGRGLMLGAVLRPEHSGRAAEILDHAANAGLLLLQAGPGVLQNYSLGRL